jgi:hypothetical protein
MTGKTQTATFSLFATSQTPDLRLSNFQSQPNETPDQNDVEMAVALVDLRVDRDPIIYKNWKTNQIILELLDNSNLYHNSILNLFIKNYNKFTILMLILFDAENDLQIKIAKKWVKWGRDLKIRFIAGASNYIERSKYTAHLDLFDFFYVSKDDGGLLHAPRLILDSAGSMISYDFSDLRSLWDGRQGEVWRIPAERAAIRGAIETWALKNGNGNPPNCLFRYDGPASLAEVIELMEVVRALIQKGVCVWAAWQVGDVHETGLVELCLMDDPSYLVDTSE